MIATRYKETTSFFHQKISPEEVLHAFPVLTAAENTRHAAEWSQWEQWFWTQSGWRPTFATAVWSQEVPEPLLFSLFSSVKQIIIISITLIWRIKWVMLSSWNSTQHVVSTPKFTCYYYFCLNYLSDLSPTLIGAKLTSLPSSTCNWGRWSLHPKISTRWAEGHWDLSLFFYFKYYCNKHHYACLLERMLSCWV